MDNPGSVTGRIIQNSIISPYGAKRKVSPLAVNSAYGSEPEVQQPCPPNGRNPDSTARTDKDDRDQAVHPDMMLRTIRGSPNSPNLMLARGRVLHPWKVDISG